MKQDFFCFETNLEEEDPPAQNVQLASPRVFSVTELTAAIREVLEGGFLDVWVSGEVTNFRNRSGRHWYFALKDASSQIGTVIFNAESRKFPFQLEDGLEVVVHGKLNVYAPRGSYSLIIDHIEPKGLGALQLAFEQLKKKLAAEGLFDKVHKKPLPFFPKKIGVITSPTGAAIRDIIKVLTRRCPGIHILLHPAKVQGEGAAQEIAEAIATMNERDDLELLIVGRGGGSIEDLWAFNEEIVARALFASRLPIISAVGHEIDFTIADFVADVRAPTPSVAAEIAVPVREELLAQLTQMKRQLYFALSQHMQREQQLVQQLRMRLKDPRTRFPDFLLRLDSLDQRLRLAMHNRLQQTRQQLEKLYSNLDHLSPLGILAKGYAVVQKKGKAVRKVKELSPGDIVDMRFVDGATKAKTF